LISIDINSREREILKLTDSLIQGSDKTQYEGLVDPPALKNRWVTMLTIGVTRGFLWVDSG